MYNKAGLASHEKRANSTPAWPLHQLPLPGSCLKRLPQLPSDLQGGRGGLHLTDRVHLQRQGQRHLIHPCPRSHCVRSVKMKLRVTPQPLPCASLVSRGALSHFIEISPRAKFFYILPVSYNRTEPSVSISETCRFHMTPTPRAKIGQELEAQASLSFPGDFMAWGREP